MSKFKIEITNPQAIEMINKFKSGDITKNIFDRIKRYKVYIGVGFVVIVIIVAAAIGKSLSQSNPAPEFKPPVIENPSATPTISQKSVFQPIRDNISNFSSSMPDPAVPDFDDNINLEPPTL